MNFLLSQCRTLDLTDEQGLLCGKILADLGVEVIKVERPGGDPARRCSPFFKDTAHPEKSLYWSSFNLNKKSITLNIETTDGQEIFRKLVQGTDFVIESFPPGYMADLGVGYGALSRINPRLIMTSITPFGQSGHYRDYKASDLIIAAMSGQMHLYGDRDRPPVRISFPQAGLHSGAEAAVGTMLAYYYREATGEGQHVDISMQQSVAVSTFNAVPFWHLNKVIIQRAGAFRSGLTSAAAQRNVWPCKDGYVSFSLMGGIAGKEANQALVQWMHERGIRDEFTQAIDWETFDLATATEEFYQCISQPINKLFLIFTKAELYEEARERGIHIYPISGFGELLANVQLKARDFWVEVEHPELGASITYPGRFVIASKTPAKTARRAPLIGEHNQEIFTGLGLLAEDLVTLKQAGVI